MGWVVEAVPVWVSSHHTQSCKIERNVMSLTSSNFLSRDTQFKIYRAIFLPVFPTVVKLGQLTLEEDCRLKAFKNRVLRNIFCPKKEEVTGG
jgi:hypothetical protein